MPLQKITTLLTTNVSNCGFVHDLGNMALKPGLFLWGGKQVSFLKIKIQRIPSLTERNFHSCSTWIQTAVAICLVVPGTLVGVVLKQASYFFSLLVQMNHSLAKIMLIRAAIKEENKSDYNKLISNLNLRDITFFTVIQSRADMPSYFKVPKSLGSLCLHLNKDDLNTVDFIVTSQIFIQNILPSKPELVVDLLTDTQAWKIHSLLRQFPIMSIRRDVDRGSLIIRSSPEEWSSLFTVARYCRYRKKEGEQAKKDWIKAFIQWNFQQVPTKGGPELIKLVAAYFNFIDILLNCEEMTRDRLDLFFNQREINLIINQLDKFSSPHSLKWLCMKSMEKHKLPIDSLPEEVQVDYKLFADRKSRENGHNM